MEYANEEMGRGRIAEGGISHRFCKQNESVDVLFCFLVGFFCCFFLVAQHFSDAHRMYFSEMTLGGSFTPQGIWSMSASTASTLVVRRDADLKFLSLGDGGSEDGCAAVESVLKRFFIVPSCQEVSVFHENVSKK